MKNVYFILSLLLFISNNMFSQTWSDDVAQIFYDKCTSCHRPGGAGGFSLVTYQEASSLASFMYDEINTNEMPPWPPNNDYVEYAHDRALSSTQKATVLNWLSNGTPEGNPANTPPPPVFNTGAILGNGDLEIQMPAYTSQATSSEDDYTCFTIPSGLTEDRVIKAIEVIPGNDAIVHHALIYVDSVPANSPTDSAGSHCITPSSSTASLACGFAPGAVPTIFPSQSPLKMGVNMGANSQIIFAMHYPEGSFGQSDSTKVIFHFYPLGETGVRDVLAVPILQNWSLYLPPEQVTSASASYTIDNFYPDLSFISVFPHMHLIGDNMKVYGLDPNQDTVRMIDVPHWDFEWQDFYYFKNMKHVQAGTTLKADAVYDNTSGNVHNPNSPAQTITAGFNTADEMLVVYFHFMQYQPGDENYNMDSLMNLTIADIVQQNQLPSEYLIYPNPFDEQVNIRCEGLSPGDNASVYIYDFNGKLIKELIRNHTLQNEILKLVWDGKTTDGAEANSGLYYVSYRVNGQVSYQKLIKR